MPRRDRPPARDPTGREPFEPAGFFVLRTPLLPFDEYQAWCEDLEAASLATADAHALEPAVARDSSILAARLRARFARPGIREALYLASPGLEAAASRWMHGEDRRDAKVERALARYFARMTFRATPFGLFAAISTGGLAASTTLRLPHQKEWRRRTRIDHLLLQTIADQVLTDQRALCHARVVPNSSLYEAGGRLRFIRYHLRGWRRAYEIAAVEPTPYLRRTLATAEQGATIAALARQLTDEDVDLDQAREFVLELVERQILVADAGPGVTGPDPLLALLDFLANCPGLGATRERLERMRDSLSALDRAGFGHEPSAYVAIDRTCAELGVESDPRGRFQVDFVRPSQNLTLGRDVAEEIAHCLSIIERFHAGPHQHDIDLGRFARGFLERYGDRELPLAEVLDEDLGLGYRNGPDTSPLLAQFDFTPEDTDPGRDVNPHLLRWLCGALASGADEIELGADELEALSTNEAPPLPDAVVAVVELGASSEEAVRQGEYRVFLRVAAGPSGAALFGRFCHSDPDLKRRVEQYLELEQARRPDVIFAEVVHLPQGRTGNIVARPVLRQYEIPYLGRSGAPKARQLPLTDLLVSVRRGRVVLRSKRLGREIVPRLSTAHDFTTGSLAAYRFLGALQHQGAASRRGWDWGGLGSAPFLPRVRIGRVVLAKACYRLERAELQPIVAAKGAERFRLARALREARRLPERVACVQGERHLLVDFRNVLSVDAFADEVKSRAAVTLEEILPDETQLCVRGSQGSFTHELMIPFLRRETQREISPPGPPRRTGTLPRTSTFLPGSNWLFARLYTGRAEADRVLTLELRQWLQRLRASGGADAWFFIRYTDPHLHLRLRLRGDPVRLREEVLPELAAVVAPLVENGRVWKLVFDTYEREVDRYGGPGGIVHAEEIFCNDSHAVVEVLAALPRGDGLDTRFRLAGLGMHRLLEDFGLSLQERILLLAELRDALSRDLGVEQWFRVQSGTAYRKERKGLEALLAGHSTNEPLGALGRHFESRSECNREPVAGLRGLDLPPRRLDSIVQSLLHMHANRMLRSAHRKYELVLYDFLCRVYESRLARGTRA